MNLFKSLYRNSKSPPFPRNIEQFKEHIQQNWKPNLRQAHKGNPASREPLNTMQQAAIRRQASKSNPKER